ncbi:MAG: caspase family protein [Chitinophagaceae bacterium]
MKLWKKLLMGTFFFSLYTSNANAQEPNLILPIGNTETISSLKFSKSGKYLVSSSNLDNNVIVWEAATGRIIFNYKELKGNIQSSLLTEDEQYVVIFLSDKLIKWLDLKDGSTVFQTDTDNINYSRWMKVLTTNENKFVVFFDNETVYYKEFKSSADQDKFHQYGISFKSKNKNIETVEVKDRDILIIKYDNGMSEELNLKDGTVENRENDTNNRLAKLAGIIIKTEGSKIFVTDTINKTQPIELTGNGENFIERNSLLSPTGMYITAVTEAGTVFIWQTIDWKQVNSFKTTATTQPLFVNNETRLLFKARNSFLLYDVNKGTQLAELKTDNVLNGPVLVEYSPDGKWMAWAKDLLIMVFDLQQGKFLTYLRGGSDKLNNVSVSGNENLLLSASWDRFPKVWDLKKGKIIQYFKKNAHSSLIGEANLAYFSKDDEQIISMDIMGTYGWSSTAQSWNRQTGNLSTDNFNTKVYTGAVYGKDGKFIAAWEKDNLTLIGNGSNKTSERVISLYYSIVNIVISPDNDLIAAILSNKSIKLWSVSKNKFIGSPLVVTDKIKNIKFSTDSKLLATGSSKGDIAIFQLVNGSKQVELIGHRKDISALEFSPDGSLLISASQDETFKVWNTSTGDLMKTITGHKDYFRFSSPFYLANIQFSSDGKFFLTSSGGGMTKKWETKTLTELNSVNNTGLMQYLSADNQFFITIDNAIIRFYNTASMEMDIAYLPIDSTDYLVVDKYSRYDGTEAARRKLYFTCGKEIIELEQAKDQLWIPNLAERIWNGETINASKLSDLNLCGLTPVVENETKSNDTYHFTITSRLGGLGETIIYVNGIEAKRYKPEQLKKTGKNFELTIKKDELKHLFVAGKENPVTIKSLTADNSISSRGLILNEDQTDVKPETPNLYAVMIGVSDYKGEELDLNYAAKDATDISAAVASAGRKLLNTDGTEHVFMYNLTTEKERYLFPEKNNIKKVLAEIGKKATASDILIIFFAGHGVMEPKTKNFYFLTSDASPSSSVNAVESVGISMDTLMNWVEPSKIKAQKRILIFDACNSGQAIKDIVQSGKMMARNDNKAQLIKAIDKLNEKSGLFILAGSASDQSAYEIGTYGQGLLTYSLLKAIKQQPAILEENKFLNVSNWFREAENTVGEIAKEVGAIQQPQIVSNNNFNIGVLDEEVMSGITLLKEKPMFTTSIFMNSDPSVADDDLNMSKLINLRLSEMAAMGKNSKIVYTNSTGSTNGYSLTGLYIVTGGNVSITVNFKNNNVVKSKFELSGSKDKLDELVNTIAEKATLLIDIK